MIDFIEECRREWKRLGVPDPIANEMAVDLTADIEEAEAEGGSAEDVLGNSYFDPRRFAAAWASARGVTAPPSLIDPFIPPARVRHPWYRPAIIVTIGVFGILAALAAAALVFGVRSAAVAGPIGRIALPGSRLFGPSPVLPSFRHVVFGPSFSAQGVVPFAILASILLLFVIVVVAFVVLFGPPFSRRDSKQRH
jgi:hypothetical protein